MNHRNNQQATIAASANLVTSDRIRAYSAAGRLDFIKALVKSSKIGYVLSGYLERGLRGRETAEISSMPLANESIDVPGSVNLKIPNRSGSFDSTRNPTRTWKQKPSKFAYTLPTFRDLPKKSWHSKTSKPK